jgi:hypothetical protein
MVRVNFLLAGSHKEQNIPTDILLKPLHRVSYPFEIEFLQNNFTF